MTMQEIRSTSEPFDAAPAATLAWGWAGVMPFVALVFAIGFADATLADRAQTVLVSYGAIILTFMGGVHWGLEMSRAGRSWLLYTSGIGPSLFAVIAILLPFAMALLVLAVGFLGLLGFDLWLRQQALVPHWYSRLRIQLTVAVVSCLTLAGVMA